MNEIRCPKCGTLNPDNLKTCRFCQSLLNPPKGIGGETTPEKSQENPPEEISGRLILTDAFDQPEDFSGNNMEDEIPDWLIRIRQRELENRQSEEVQEPVIEPIKEEDLPGWAAGRAMLEPPVEEPVEEEEDWLTRLRKRKGLTDPESLEEPPSTFSVSNAGELSDSAEKSEELRPISGEHPDSLLSRILSTDTKPLEEFAAGDLNSQSADESEQLSENHTGQAENGEFVDWLRSLEENPTPKTCADSTKESSAGLMEEHEISEERLRELESEQGGPPDDEIPGWLSDIMAGNGDKNTADIKRVDVPPKEDNTPAVEKSGAVPQPTADREIPDWLKELGVQLTPPAAEEHGSKASMQPGIENGTAGQDEFQFPIASLIPPDFKKDFDNGASTEGHSNEAEILAGSAPEFLREDVEDWFAQLSKDDAADRQPTDSSAGEPEEATPETLPRQDELESERADLLEGKPSPQEPPAGKSEPAEKHADKPASGEKAAANREAMEWFTPGPEPFKTAEAVTAEGLEPATIPSWLEAMRPVESILGDQTEILDDDQIVESGPLAGLSGILPAENPAVNFRNPPVYSSRLHVSDRQRAQANVLESLLAGTVTTQSVQKDKTKLIKGFGRLVVVALLFLAVLYPILFASPTHATPGLEAGADIQIFKNRVDTISTGQTVLVAFDYEAGYAGEMRFAAKGLIEQLLQKQLNLVLLSTVPAGPVLADDFMRQVTFEMAAVGKTAGRTSGGQVTNLGYLPGGLSSLHELALNPRGAARIEFGSRGTVPSVWDDPALKNIHKIGDFSAVIVLTDSVDTGRAWVEQTGQWLDTTPLLLVTSAQSAPILKLYVNSGQAAGLLAGLKGGMAYERLADTPGNAAAYWNSFRYGIFIMISILLVGILYGSAAGIFSKGKTPE